MVAVLLAVEAVVATVATVGDRSNFDSTRPKVHSRETNLNAPPITLAIALANQRMPYTKNWSVMSMPNKKNTIATPTGKALYARLPIHIIRVNVEKSAERVGTRADREKNM